MWYELGYKARLGGEKEEISSREEEDEYEDRKKATRSEEKERNEKDDDTTRYIGQHEHPTFVELVDQDTDERCEYEYGQIHGEVELRQGQTRVRGEQVDQGGEGKVVQSITEERYRLGDPEEGQEVEGQVGVSVLHPVP